MSRIVKEPLLHFVLLGALIFMVALWREGRRPDEQAAAQIEITTGTLASLREGFRRSWNREPDADELRGLINAHLREEVLYREAVAMGLDRDDTIVRRRMAQKMEFLTQDIVAAVEPDDAALRAFFEENSERYAMGARASFRHVYFSKARRGARLETDVRDALSSLTQGVAEENLGDPFLSEYEFTDATEVDITAIFGADFASKLASTPVGDWQGPVASEYGLHLVRVSKRGEPQPAAFDAVRDAVVRDFSEERRLTANQEYYEQLKAQYRITMDESVVAAVSATTTSTASK